MTASKAEIDRWIARALEMGATHIISVCDTFDYEDYPAYIMPSDRLEEMLEHYRSAPMQVVNEIIDIDELRKESQPKDPKHEADELIKRNFCGNEERDYKNFTKHHVCPDRKLHDNVPYEVTLSYSCASGIGSNTYVKCERCGCMQDITDYSQW